MSSVLSSYLWGKIPNGGRGVGVYPSPSAYFPSRDPLSVLGHFIHNMSHKAFWAWCWVILWDIFEVLSFSLSRTGLGALRKLPRCFIVWTRGSVSRGVLGGYFAMLGGKLDWNPTFGSHIGGLWYIKKKTAPSCQGWMRKEHWRITNMGKVV